MNGLSISTDLPKSYKPSELFMEAMGGFLPVPLERVQSWFVSRNGSVHLITSKGSIKCTESSGKEIAAAYLRAKGVKEFQKFYSPTQLSLAV